MAGKQMSRNNRRQLVVAVLVASWVVLVWLAIIHVLGATHVL